MQTLDPALRRELKARAHGLSAVVIIGNDGLTAPVMAEIDRALKSHELIKIRAASGDRDTREAWLRDICAQTGSHLIQHIGKILVIFRPREKSEVPAVKPAKRAHRRTADPARTRALDPARKPSKSGRSPARPARTVESGGRTRPASVRKGLFPAAPAKAEDAEEKRSKPRPHPRTGRPSTRTASRTRRGH